LSYFFTKVENGINEYTVKKFYVMRGRYNISEWIWNW